METGIHQRERGGVGTDGRWRGLGPDWRTAPASSAGGPSTHQLKYTSTKCPSSQCASICENPSVSPFVAPLVPWLFGQMSARAVAAAAAAVVRCLPNAAVLGALKTIGHPLVASLMISLPPAL